MIYGKLPEISVLVHTTHLGENDVLLPAHGTFLDPNALPMILMQNVKRTYLGII